MYQDKRPTCVTVIGWTWSIIGSLMCLSAIMVLSSSMISGEMTGNQPDTPFIFRFFPLFAVVQIGVAALGIIAGISFLKLKAWSRNVLEGLTWLFLLFIIGFVIIWLFNSIFIMSGHGQTIFIITRAVIAVVTTGIYGVPLWIMLKYLRGPKVRNALHKTVEPTNALDKQ